MIGRDTNILVRLWLDCEPARNWRIDTLLAERGGASGSLLVTDVVLAEAVWTLRSAFDQKKAEQLLAIRSLLNETAFAFEDSDAATQAADMFEHGSCGLSDCLAVDNHSQNVCDLTATFDRGIRKLPGVKLL